MAQQDIRFYLNGMLFVLDKDQLVCVATDGHRLSYATMPVEGNFSRQEIIVPRKTVIELSSCWAKPTIPSPLTSRQPGAFQFWQHRAHQQGDRWQVPRLQTARSRPHTARSSRWIVAAAAHAAARGDPVERALPWRGSAWPASGALEDRLYQQRAGRSGGRIEVAFTGRRSISASTSTTCSMRMRRCRQTKSPLRWDSSASALFTVPGQNDFKYVVMPMRI